MTVYKGIRKLIFQIWCKSTVLSGRCFRLCDKISFSKKKIQGTRGNSVQKMMLVIAIKIQKNEIV